MEEGGGGEGSRSESRSPTDLYFLLFASSACIYVMHLLQLLPIGLLALLAAAQDAQSVGPLLFSDFSRVDSTAGNSPSQMHS
jgi:hypothetical protein